ncbi:hypothetical protein D3C81_1860840 [compost metagenome]
MPGNACTCHCTDHHQGFKHRDAATAAHGRADEGKDRDQQQRVTLQDAQRARGLAQNNLHVQRAADQRQANDAQQHQVAPFTPQPHGFIAHRVSLQNIDYPPVYTLARTFESLEHVRGIRGGIDDKAVKKGLTF